MQFLVTVTLTDLAAAPDLDAHRAYLKEQFAAGVFLAFGPLPRRHGGWILAEAESEAAI